MLRATQLGITNQAINFNRTQFAAIARLQRQLSSGLRFEKPSEAPLEAARVQSLNETLQNLRSDQTQLPEAQRILNQSVSTLLEIQNITNRAKQISLDAFQQNDTKGSKVLADEVDGLLVRLKSLVDTKTGGQYLFSGTDSKQAPIQFITDPQLPIPIVQYIGSNERSSIGVSQTITIDTRYSAGDFLFTKDRDQSLFFGTTGAKAGQGTDNGVGRASLQVVHTQTLYPGASGIQTGTSSRDGDTVIGQTGVHSLTIEDTSGTGAFGTVSLNGGTPVAFASSDTDLEVIGPRGEKVFVNTTAIAAGFSGPVDLEARGTLSTDGGLTKTRINFLSNQVVRNQLTQQVTNIDSTEITRTGQEYIEYVGSSDLFTALYELKADLLNDRQLGTTERSEALSRRAGDIERATDQILKTVGLQSVSLQSLDAIDRRQADQQLELRLSITEIQAIDLAQAATELQNRQILVQANFASLSIVQNLSVLNFLG